jgi:hypothetical protein
MPTLAADGAGARWLPYNRFVDRPISITEN